MGERESFGANPGGKRTEDQDEPKPPRNICLGHMQEVKMMIELVGHIRNRISLSGILGLTNIYLS